MIELAGSILNILQPQINTAMQGRAKQKRAALSSTEREKYASEGFQFNIPILVLILLSIPSMFALANKVAVEVLLTGLCITYTLDFLAFKEGTIVAMAATLSVTWLTMYISSIHLILHSMGNIFMVLNSGFVVAVIAIWGLLQFRWMYKMATPFCVVLERILLTALPILCAPRVFSAVIAMTGITGNSPYLLSLIFCVYLHFFSSRRDSAIESAFMIGISVAMPTFAYAMLHIKSFQFMALGPNIAHLANISTLISIPAVFMARDPRKYLSWLASNDPEEKKYDTKRFQTIRLGLCAGFFPIGLWIQMNVFLGHYRYLTAVPMTTALILYTTATVALSYVATVLFNGFKGKLHRLAACYMSSLAALCFSVALGVSIVVLPLPIAVAFFLCDFFFSPSWVQFLLAGTAGVFAVGWWLARSMWFLEYEFYLTVLPLDWSLNMKHATFAILIFQSLSVASVPLVMMGNPNSQDASGQEMENPIISVSRSVVLFLQGVFLAFLEQLLYEQQYAENNTTGNTFYSPFLIFVTTFIGIYFSYYLHTRGKLNSNVSSLLVAVYIGKLGMLLAPSRTTMIALFLNTLGLSRLYFAFIRKEHLSLRQAYSYFAYSGVVSILTRHAVASQVISILFMLSSVTQQTNLSETRVIGFAILMWGFTMLPFTYSKIKVMNKEGRPVKFMKNVALIMLVVGLIWSVWQPVLHHDTSFMAWFDVFTAFIALLCFVFPLPKNIASRVVLFVYLGAAAGFMFCKSLMPHAPLMEHLPFIIAVCCAFTCAALVLYLAHFPPGGSYIYASYCYVAFLASLPVARLATSVVDFQLAVYSVATVLSILMSLVMKFKLTGRPLLKTAPSSETESTMAYKSVPNSEELAVANNLSVVVSFFLGLILNIVVGEWSYTTFLVLPAVFLLLHRDSFIFSNLTEEKRYLVVLVIAQLESILLLFRDMVTAFSASGFSIRYTSTYLMKISAVCLLCLPAHILFVKFIVSLRRPSIRPILICLGISILGFLLIPQAFAASLVVWNVMGITGLAFMLFTTVQYSTQGVTLL